MLSSQVLLHMSSKQKVFITKATIPDTFLSTNLCFPLLCSYKWLPNKKHSLNKLRFRTHSHHKLCAFFSCAFTNIFQTKSIHYTSYNSGHILIIKFVLSSHVLLQMSSKQKVFITEATTPDTIKSESLCFPLITMKTTKTTKLIYFQSLCRDLKLVILSSNSFSS